MLRSDSLKKKIYTIFGVICFLVLILTIAFIKELKSKEKETSQKVPVPLTIKNPDWEPHRVFNGTIVIDGEGIQGCGYEGIMYIEMDGDKIRISCTEAVRSRYGEWF